MTVQVGESVWELTGSLGLRERWWRDIHKCCRVRTVNPGATNKHKLFHTLISEYQAFAFCADCKMEISILVISLFPPLEMEIGILALDAVRQFPRNQADLPGIYKDNEVTKDLEA